MQQKILAVFDVDDTIVDGFLDDALFSAMKENEKYKEYGMEGEETWPEIVNRVLKTHPPYEHQI